MSNITIFKPEQVGPAFNSEKMKAQAAEIAKACSEIEIVDESSLSIADQMITRANKVSKDIEAIRVSLKAPILDIGKRIDAAAKDLSAEIDAAVKDVKAQKLAYNQLLQKKKAEKQAELDRIANAALETQRKEAERIRKVTNWIQEFETNTTKEIFQAKDEAGLQTIFANRIKVFPSDEFFGEFLQDANAAKDRVKSAGKQRREFFAKLANVEPEKVKELERKEEKRKTIITENAERRSEELESKSTEALANVEADAQMQIADIAGQSAAVDAEKVSGITKRWDFEIVNLNEVPRGYLKIDEAAIRSWMNGNKEVLKDGEVISGIKYFIKEGVRIGS